ncbi:hypothetical protein C8R42DRAFT_729156 [Lentinula raphanica]|nr:hypothetical protein C8R42DRAFT_729156 [Lentinula raphanica]
MAHDTPSLDKADIVMEEQVNPALLDGDPLPPEGSEERILAEQKLVRKLDTRVLPTIVLIFIMNYIDRTPKCCNNCKIEGLGAGSTLIRSTVQRDSIYSLRIILPGANSFEYGASSFVAFTLFLKNFFALSRPSFYIGTCIIIWGLISTLTGISQSYWGILAITLCIGIPESAFYPGGELFRKNGWTKPFSSTEKLYPCYSRWYTKKELAFRSAILYGGLLNANAFGALMAAGILANMEGKLGIRAWRWVSFIKGSITMFIGLIMPLLG